MQNFPLVKKLIVEKYSLSEVSVLYKLSVLCALSVTIVDSDFQVT